MKIGIDLRFINEDIYSNFVLQIIDKFTNKKNDDFFTIYTSRENKVSINKKIKNKNINIKKIDIKRGSFSEQTQLKKILKKDENHLMIFFDQFKPIFYKKDYITFIGSLKDFYYSNFSSSLEKSKFFYLASKNFQKSKKIICLDSKTKDELIEKFNIKSEKIEVISGFFPKLESFDYDEVLEKSSINLSTKYAIKNPFFLYSGGNSIEKNYEKLVSVFHKLQKKGHNLDLVFLGNHISSNVTLRNIILEKNMQKNVFFLGELDETEKKYLYGESLGIIFPSFYEPFPFKLSEAVYFGKQIISSDLKQVKNIFDEKINYFSPISENSILESLEKYLSEKTYEKQVDYCEIKQKYTLENTVNEFEEIFDKQ